MQSILRRMAVWLIHVGLWLVFVSKISLWEILVGAAAAGLATLGVVLLWRLRLVEFRLNFRQMAEIERIPWYAVSGTWEILQGIAKQLFTKRGAPSYLAAVPFEIGSNGHAEPGRRALAVFYTTRTPNFVVIGIIREQSLLLYHQIVPAEVLTITRNLGAKP